MLHEVVMPQLGLTMTEGSVTNWLKEPGDRIERGEPLFTVETDKVEMDVESTRGGYINSIVLETGKVVQVGTVIASLVDEASEVGTPLEERVSSSPTTSGASKQETRQPQVRAEKASTGRGPRESATSTAGGAGTYPVSPRARSLAKSLGVDVTRIVPSGIRVVEEDVRRYTLESAGKDEDEASGISSGRAAIARRTSASFRTAPHFYLSTVANADALVKLRESLAEKSEKEIGVRLTYTDVFLKALATALRDQPEVNSQWRDDKVVRGSSVDVGFAVQGSETLLVPVLRNVDALRLLDLAARRHDLTARARKGDLTLDETEGGSATLSNLGAFDIDWFEAILNAPQSVILSTGKIAERPVVVNGRLDVASTVVLTLSVDHRVLDGVAAAGFLQRIKYLIEEPYALLL